MPNFHGLPLSMTPSFDSSSLSSLSNSRGHASSHDEKIRRIDDAVKIKRFFFSVSSPLLLLPYISYFILLVLEKFSPNEERLLKAKM